MQTSVTFKNLDPSDTLKNYVKDKLDRFDRLLDNPADANVVLSVEKHRHIADINISGDRLLINGKEETNDMYSAIDMVMDKLEIQIKRGKSKIRDRRLAQKTREIDRMASPVSGPEMDFVSRVRVESIEYKPMHVEEAIEQMDLDGDEFLVFTNAVTDEINVLYQRKDGNLGLIQPRN